MLCVSKGHGTFANGSRQVFTELFPPPSQDIAESLLLSVLLQASCVHIGLAIILRNAFKDAE